MPTNEVAILADDLTGALDAAAPFASPGRPVAVLWGDRVPPPEGGFALDSETREIPARRAEAVVARLLPYLAGRSIALKKMDSLLRGNTVRELAACWKERVFGSLVVAPAFPAQGRVTRGATQFVRLDGEWQAVGPNLVSSLQQQGAPARAIGREEKGDGEEPWMEGGPIRLAIRVEGQAQNVSLADVVGEEGSPQSVHRLVPVRWGLGENESCEDEAAGRDRGHDDARQRQCPRRPYSGSPRPAFRFRGSSEGSRGVATRYNGYGGGR